MSSNFGQDLRSVLGQNPTAKGHEANGFTEMGGLEQHSVLLHRTSEGDGDRAGLQQDRLAIPTEVATNKTEMAQFFVAQKSHYGNNELERQLEEVGHLVRL
jgi:hypothetical protein